MKSIRGIRYIDYLLRFRSSTQDIVPQIAIMIIQIYFHVFNLRGDLIDRTLYQVSV